MKSCKRRHFLLLEVLIAFAIIVMAILPLVYPHFYIYQQQRTFIDKIDLDMTVNLLFAQVQEKLYRNEIIWGEIESSRVFPVTQQLLEEVGIKNPIPYNGVYSFKTEKQKKNDQFALYLVDLTFTFTPKKGAKQSTKGQEGPKPLVYPYKLFISQLYKSVPQNTPNAGGRSTP